MKFDLDRRKLSEKGFVELRSNRLASLSSESSESKRSDTSF